MRRHLTAVPSALDSDAVELARAMAGQPELDLGVPALCDTALMAREVDEDGYRQALGPDLPDEQLHPATAEILGQMDLLLDGLDDEQRRAAARNMYWDADDTLRVRQLRSVDDIAS